MVEEYRDAYQNAQHYNDKINIIVSLIQHVSENERIIQAQKINNLRELIRRLDSLDYEPRQEAIMNVHAQLDAIFNETLDSLEQQRSR